MNILFAKLHDFLFCFVLSCNYLQDNNFFCILVVVIFITVVIYFPTAVKCHSVVGICLQSVGLQLFSCMLALQYLFLVWSKATHVAAY